MKEDSAFDKYLVPFIFAIHFLFEKGEGGFNEFEPITEILGVNFFYLRVLPGTHFNVVLMSVLFLYVAAKALRNPAATRIFTGQSRAILLLHMVLPAALLIAAMKGMTSGGTFSNVMLQIRDMMLSPMLFLLFYFAMDNWEKFYRCMNFMLFVNILKALQGLYVFYSFHNGTMANPKNPDRDYEYLIEHFTSEYFLISAFYCVGRAIFLSKNFLHRVLWIVPIFLMLPAFQLNDRRTALVAIVLGVGIILASIPWKILKKYLWVYAMTVVVGLVAIRASQFAPAPFNKVWKKIEKIIYQGEDAGYIDYRVVENFNIYTDIVQNGIVGLGYGRSLNFAFVEYDFSWFYPLFGTLPHNSFLATWAFGGLLSMAALATFWSGLIVYFVSILVKTNDMPTRFAAMLGIAQVARMGIWAIADIGLGDFRTHMCIALFTGAVARLCKLPTPKKRAARPHLSQVKT
jgi:hypothetical protein